MPKHASVVDSSIQIFPRNPGVSGIVVVGNGVILKRLAENNVLETRGVPDRQIRAGDLPLWVVKPVIVDIDRQEISFFYFMFQKPIVRQEVGLDSAAVFIDLSPI